MTQFQILCTFLGTIFAAVCALIVGVYSANRKARTDEAAQAQAQASKQEESSATVKVAVIADRQSWEDRLVARVAALEDTIEKERSARHELEEKAQNNKLELQKIRAELERVQAEKVIASKDFQDKIIEQDVTIDKLRCELHDLNEKYKKLQHEYEDLLKICSELKKQLAAERGEAIESVLHLASNIGVAEGSPHKRRRTDKKTETEATHEDA